MRRKVSSAAGLAAAPAVPKAPAGRDLRIAINFITLRRAGNAARAITAGAG